jgi:hypothetical protein
MLATKNMEFTTYWRKCYKLKSLAAFHLES